MTSPFAQLPSLGRAIGDIVQPTFKLYAPLLLANEAAIRSTKRTTHQYGPHDRQHLDVYHPSTPHTRHGRRPVLVFLYGGGLVNGAKQIPGFANGTAHANVGHFFAAKFGFTTVVVDYRLLSHGARFPSGGEDLALAVDWIREHRPGPGESDDAIDLFLLGNSAGGVHAAQFLFCADFATTRAALSTGTGPRLRGVVMLGVPFDFARADAARVDAALKPYFGDDIEGRCALGQIRGLQRAGEVPDFIRGTGTRVLLLDAELDPEEEILTRATTS